MCCSVDEMNITVHSCAFRKLAGNGQSKSVIWIVVEAQNNPIEMK